MDIQKDASVIIEYSVRLADGRYVKGENEPVSLNFIVGYDQIMPSLEQRLLGLQEGSEVEFIIPAREAFGEHKPALVKRRSFAEFPHGRELEPGRWVVAKNDAKGAQYSYYVLEKNDKGVVLDYNHPLAGEDLYYQVKVVRVRPALKDELEYLRPCEFQNSES